MISLYFGLPGWGKISFLSKLSLDAAKRNFNDKKITAKSKKLKFPFKFSSGGFYKLKKEYYD